MAAWTPPALLEAAVAGGAEGSGADTNPVVYAADDYATLGGYLGYEEERRQDFVASIERYNELCATGLDEDFGKEKSLMFAVNQPPYYAYKGEKSLGGMLCNTSGVAIDENGHRRSPAYSLYSGPIRRRKHRGQPLRHSVHDSTVWRFHRLRRHPG